MNNLEKDKSNKNFNEFKKFLIFMCIILLAYWSTVEDASTIIPLILGVVFFIFVVLMIKTVSKSELTNYQLITFFPKVLNDSEVDKIIPDFNQEDFLYNAYNMFLETQNAYSNFDHKTLKALLVNDLYLDYKNSLQLLSDNKQKRVKEYFTKERFGITNIKTENGIVIVETYLKVNFYHYVVNHLGNIISGNANVKAYYVYKITYTTTPTHNKKVKLCPNCNAEIKNNTFNCEYCKTFLGPKNYNWIISNIEVISRRN